MQWGIEQDLPTHPRIMRRSALLNIRSILDGLVELITNSDASYTRLEKEGKSPSGLIVVEIMRDSHGQCSQFAVIDYAEGIEKERLEQVITFGGVTETQLDRSVRALFGQGLKEVCIAMGKGEIFSSTPRSNIKAEVWWDEEREKPRWKPVILPNDEKPEILKNTSSGTIVRIYIDHKVFDKSMIASYGTFKEQLSQHYSLRLVNSNPKRQIRLKFVQAPGRRIKGISYEIPITYAWPTAEIVLDSKVFQVQGDKFSLTLYLSEEPIEDKMPYRDPFTNSGILLIAGGNILEMPTLFKWSQEEVSRYFWGKIESDALAERIRPLSIS